jgi:hypothetical protein
MKDELRIVIRLIILRLHKLFFYYHYKKIVNLLEPNFFKLDKKTLGRPGDGTYILPVKLIENNPTLISLGIADDISFEEDFLKHYPGSKVLAFDPSIDALPSNSSQISFESKGIAGRYSTRKKHITLDSVINKLPNLNTDIILKIDIEGWEWNIFENFDFKNYKIPVIVIEFHFLSMNSIYEWLFFPFYFYKRYKILKKVLKKYFIMHLHANNYGYTSFKDFTFPWLCEMTLIKKEPFLEEYISDVKKINTINCKNKIDIQFPFYKK